ncbi:hypothetical protein [Mycobacterium nebraskense]|uniref:hypothetical protein n=1 Tax=Mycobacterium nebraskense TaxID=244292 RepID=UPI000B18E1C2|nr:hypothetical protein [Mycobacterium nebraskense]
MLGSPPRWAGNPGGPSRGSTRSASALRQGAVAPNENVLSEQGAAAAKTLHQPVG